METYDIILQAGQSNAAGYGHGPAEHPYIPHERIVYLTGSDPMAEGYDPETESFSVEIAAERPNPEFGPEDRLGDLSLSFAQNYVAQGRLAEGRKLLILRQPTPTLE